MDANLQVHTPLFTCTALSKYMSCILHIWNGAESTHKQGNPFLAVRWEGMSYKLIPRSEVHDMYTGIPILKSKLTITFPHKSLRCRWLRENWVTFAFFFFSSILQSHKLAKRPVGHLHTLCHITSKRVVYIQWKRVQEADSWYDGNLESRWKFDYKMDGSVLNPRRDTKHSHQRDHYMPTSRCEFPLLQLPRYEEIAVFIGPGVRGYMYAQSCLPQKPDVRCICTTLLYSLHARPIWDWNHPKSHTHPSKFLREDI